MKNLLLLVFVLPFMLTSCSSDDDENGISLTKDQLVGVWNVSEANGEIIPSSAIQITLKSNDSYSVKFFTNSYVGTYIIDGNTIVGTTIDPITEYFKFDALDGNNATISYNNSVGDKYKFKATKL